MYLLIYINDTPACFTPEELIILIFKAKAHLVNSILLTELIKFDVHRIEERNNVHWRNSSADVRKSNNITKKYCHIVKSLKKRKGPS